jgi:hypothetical protein
MGRRVYRRRGRLRVPAVSTRGVQRRHRCPSPDCHTFVPMERLACTTHWFALPADLRVRLNRTFRRNGQQHLAAYREALRFLNAAAQQRAGQGAARGPERKGESVTVTLAHLEVRR